MGPSQIVKLATTELEDIGICTSRCIGEIVGVHPDTLAIEAGFEALNADDSKEKPKEANEERHVDKQRGGFLQTSKNDLIPS